MCFQLGQYKRTIQILIIFCFAQQAFSQTILEDFEQDFTQYKVSTTNCTRLVHYSGSQIFIPAMAFDLVGKENVDSVDIYYRELKTPLYMVIHKIPMITKVMGQSHYLQSNGMFEIYAKVVNELVNLRDDKVIEVRLAIPPEQMDLRMEGYRFDENKAEWVSYTNRLNNLYLDNSDDDLWGGTPIENQPWSEEELMDEWAKEDSIRQVVFQSMEIFDFGLYNYDKIIEGETFVKINASFKNRNNEWLNNTVYIVYAGLNSVFSYPNYQWNTEFAIIENRDYKLFVIDNEGKVHVLKKYPKLTEIGGSEFVFDLDGGQKPTSKSELSQLTGVY